MVFSSMTFLWVFFPLVLALYYSCSFIKNKNIQYSFKNSILLIASLIFYAWGGIKYLFLMLTSILGNYLFALLIDVLDKKEKNKIKKIVFILSITFNIGLLFYFKYINFFEKIIEGIFSCNIGLREVVLPIGISFFTFQSMSYVIDVYLKKIQCQRNLMIVTLYVSFFPQLVAGPIVKYIDIENQLQERHENIDQFVSGVRRFIFGLGKKVIVANLIGNVAEKIFSYDVAGLGTVCAWIGILFYTIQIYYDFSGYSDMAIGIGRMFGFEFCENFNYPYTSLSVQEFWRRWHISLSTWFKEYVYIPLGGNRKGKVRTYINLFIVFLLTGLWHGANYTFLVWGIVYGIILVIERLFLGDLLKRNKFKLLNWLYTMLVVVLLWVFFRAPNINYAFRYIKLLFIYSEGFLSVAQISGLLEWVVLFFAILGAGPIHIIMQRLIINREKGFYLFFDYVCQISILLFSIFLLINNTFNPFIYFQF